MRIPVIEISPVSTFVKKVRQIESWKINGYLHRDNGPAMIKNYGGSYLYEWYQYGQLHRVDGPAIEWDGGGGEWWIKDHYHRTDGPARVFNDGNKQWWIEGKRIWEKE